MDTERIRAISNRPSGRGVVRLVGGGTGACRLGWLVRPQNVQGLNRSLLLSVGEASFGRMLSDSVTIFGGWSDLGRAPTKCFERKRTNRYTPSKCPSR